MAGKRPINRREYLKSSAVAVAGATLYGCSADNAVINPTRLGSTELSRANNSYEMGTAPISCSGWTNHVSDIVDYPTLERDLSADVVVVGAGLAGSSLALHLAEAGVKVAVLEARQPGWGASGRNAGHVLPTLKDVKAIRDFPDGGKRFLALFREHHAMPFDLSAKYGFDCDAEQTGYLNACGSESTFQDYKSSSRFWQEEQGQKVDLLDSADMQRMTGSSYYPYGVLYRSGGRVNPYLFTNGMITAAVQKGAQVYGNSEAMSLGKLGERWKLSSAKGSVTADRVVFCTNAYPTGIVPQVTNNFYPLTAYALSTKPLSPPALKVINPGKAALAQVPIDLNPLIIDGNNRIILSSIPSVFSPEDADLHFRNHLAWIHRTWPQAKDFDIELESYWTGRVALRDKGFPGVFELGSGVYGLMHFNAWGNVMAPLLGMLLADGLMKDQMEQLPFPLERPQRISNPNKQDLIIRKLMIPAARLGQKIGYF